MKLYRDTKDGEIKEISIKKAGVIALSIGAVTICGISYFNMKNTSQKLQHYSSYSEQVESLFDVDLNEDREQLLDSMQESLDLISDYKSSTSDEEKQRIISELLERDSKIDKDALGLIKEEVAEKRNIDKDGIEIKTSSSGIKAYFGEEGSRTSEYGKRVSLDESSLTTSVLHLRGAKESLKSTNGDSKHADDYVDALENLIKKTAKYAANTSEEKGTAK